MGVSVAHPGGNILCTGADVCKSMGCSQAQQSKEDEVGRGAGGGLSSAPEVAMRLACHTTVLYSADTEASVSGGVCLRV